MVLGWRIGYYGTVAALVSWSGFTNYQPIWLVSPSLIFNLAFLVHAIAVGFWVLRYGKTSSALWRDAGTQVRRALDRLLLFVTSYLFLIYIGPVKRTFADGDGYWADQTLASLDRLILTTDAWRITHWAFGPLTSAIDVGYAAWIPVIMIAGLLVSLFAPERLLARFFLTWALAWLLLGGLVASLLPSAGPIFGPEFGGGFLDLRHASTSAPIALWSKDVLVTALHANSNRISAGISAMPSLHCSIAFLLAFAAFRTPLFVPALLFAVFTWIGSIHLGWHYFSDGLVSLIGTATLWVACGFALGREVRASPTALRQLPNQERAFD